MSILIDKRIQKFVEGCQYENGKVISIHLKDIDETFWFDSEVAAQSFLNKQAIERVGDLELRTESFDYTDEEGVVNELTEAQLYEEYGYLMDQEHGKDTELLIDIMKCNGLDVEEKNGKYLVLDK